MTQAQITQTFIDLVKIDSPSGHEAKLAVYLQKRLTKLGLKFTTDKGGNLLAQVAGPDQPVIVCAHMDTVEPGKGIKPIVQSGMITSDGSTILGADNKAAIAAIICALESVPADRIRALEVIFTTREETEGGINQFDFSKLKSQSGLIADRAAEIGSIVLSSPWITNLDFEIIGQPVHASKPEEGINALTVAVQALSQTSWGRVDPGTTTNIGLISGGSAMNTVPGHIELTGEIRSFSAVSLKKTQSDIQAVFTKIAAANQAQLIFSATPYCLGYIHHQSDSAVLEISQLFKQLGITPYYEVVFGASDANTFAAHGIQVVTVSDGARDPHTTTESISVASLVQLTKLFTAYITQGQ